MNFEITLETADSWDGSVDFDIEQEREYIKTAVTAVKRVQSDPNQYERAMVFDSPNAFHTDVDDAPDTFDLTVRFTADEADAQSRFPMKGDDDDEITIHTVPYSSRSVFGGSGDLDGVLSEIRGFAGFLMQWVVWRNEGETLRSLPKHVEYLFRVQYDHFESSAYEQLVTYASRGLKSGRHPDENIIRGLYERHPEQVVDVLRREYEPPEIYPGMGDPTTTADLVEELDEQPLARADNIPEFGDVESFRDLVSELRNGVEIPTKRAAPEDFPDVTEYGYDVVADRSELEIRLVPRYSDGLNLPTIRMTADSRADRWTLALDGEKAVEWWDSASEAGDVWAVIRTSKNGRAEVSYNPEYYEPDRTKLAFNLLFAEVVKGRFREVETLTEAPGVGGSTAREIIAKLGKEATRSTSVEELSSVSGVGEATAENILRTLQKGEDSYARSVYNLKEYVYGVSESAMERVASKYRSIDEVAAASPSDVESVYGIGQRLAEDIVWAAEMQEKEVTRDLSVDAAEKRAEYLLEEAKDRGLVSEVIEETQPDRAGRFSYGERVLKLSTNQLSRDGSEPGKKERAKVLAHEIAHSLENHAQTPYNAASVEARLLVNSSREARRELEYIHKDVARDTRNDDTERFVNFIAFLVVKPSLARTIASNAFEELEVILREEMDGEAKEMMEIIVNEEYPFERVAA